MNWRKKEKNSREIKNRKNTSKLWICHLKEGYSITDEESLISFHIKHCLPQSANRNRNLTEITVTKVKVT